ncbi:BRISC and BRCA1-A complex member 2 [Abrus precatorius]|uniref:BRISC and BRCA1-A complex member 2 n=1 Tax=Abrus precatorius TaxID=3816 RepID=A0A8B8MHA1_ABRPR|nr:BRISC and BRCA1-A complex member 2 [Abrus precatorius]
MAAGAENVPPFITAQLNHLLSQFRLTLKVEQVWSSDKYNSGSFDRFTLLIPYCLDFIKWDVIYNAESPTVAPDVIFGPEDDGFHPFHMSPSVEESSQFSNCLSDWNYKDPARLLHLIQFLRDQYVLYQRKRVGEVDDDRLKFEISTILNREGIEMHMISGAEKCSQEVKFAVPLLDMNINKMVSGCPWRHSQKIYLQVVYPVGKKYVSAPAAPRLKLVSSSELKALVSIDDVKLPPWLDGMCLAEYLPNLEEYLEKQVLEAVSLIDFRRHFIEALASQFGRPVEADPVFCRKATFLAASGVFTFLVHFLIPTQFPKQQPALTLQSSQHFNSQMAPMKSRLMADYPWSPRWEPSQMAERIYEFLTDEALNFKRQCSEGQVQQ